jgi:hypothetical protein
MKEVLVGRIERVVDLEVLGACRERAFYGHITFKKPGIASIRGCVDSIAPIAPADRFDSSAPSAPANAGAAGEVSSWLREPEFATTLANTADRQNTHPARSSGGSIESVRRHRALHIQGVGGTGGTDADAHGIGARAAQHQGIAFADHGVGADGGGVTQTGGTRSG